MPASGSTSSRSNVPPDVADSRRDALVCYQLAHQVLASVFVLYGLMSRQVTPGGQGRLQGANTSLLGISGMVGPFVFTQTFTAFLAGPWHPPGAPFLLASGLMLGGLALSRTATAISYPG